MKDRNLFNKVINIMLLDEYALALELAKSCGYNASELYWNCFKRKFNSNGVWKQLKELIVTHNDESMLKYCLDYRTDFNINNFKIWIIGSIVRPNTSHPRLIINIEFAQQISENWIYDSSYIKRFDRRVTIELHSSNIKSYNFTKLKADILFELKSGCDMLVSLCPSLNNETKLE